MSSLSQKRAPVTAKSSSKSSEASDRLQAAREKREAARSRLREMRAAARKAQEQVDSSPLIADMAPSPKRIKEGRLGHIAGSVLLTDWISTS